MASKAGYLEIMNKHQCFVKIYFLDLSENVQIFLGGKVLWDIPGSSITQLSHFMGFWCEQGKLEAAHRAS